VTERSDFYWGDTAENYEAKRAESSIWKREDEIVERLLRQIVGNTSDSVVLDVPVGTGRFAGVVESLGCSLLGIDLSEDMLRRARDRASAQASFAIANVTDLPVRPSSVDAAICIRFAHLVDRRTLESAVSELRRTLCDDGFVVIGARLHSLRFDEARSGRWRRVLQRARRAARFRAGLANSHSHPFRWFCGVVDAAQLKIVERWDVTRYDDGSRYFIFKLRPAHPGREQPRSFELFGLPGAGKTTTARALVRDGRSDLIDGFDAVRQRSVVACFWSHPLATVGMLARLAPVARELRSPAAKRIAVTALRQRLVDIEAHDRVVHEEGTSHELWRQIMSGAEFSDAFIRRMLPVSDATILIEANPEILVERLATKGSPGPISRSLLSDAPDGETWRRAESTYARIKGILHEGSGPVFTIDNHGRSGGAVAELGSIVNGENG
jgi:ubiquinone/menaquinone biosynthesis C-methylase UbiE/dephospho-CoA kinase